MALEHSCAAPKDGAVVGYAWQLSNYPTPAETATDFAVTFVASKFGLSHCLARVVCELAQIGGRCA